MEDPIIIILTTAITVLGSILSALVVLWVKEEREKNRILRDSINSVLSELDDVYKQLIESSGPPVSYNKDMEKFDILWTTHNSSSFESMIYSGSFRMLDTNSQNKITELYNYIKVGNTASLKLLELITTNKEITEKFILNILNYGIMLSTIYLKIKELIPSVQEELKKQIP